MEGGRFSMTFPLAPCSADHVSASVRQKVLKVRQPRKMSLAAEPALHLHNTWRLWNHYLEEFQLAASTTEWVRACPRQDGQMMGDTALI